MKTYDLKHLLRTVERIRAQEHPDLDAAFLRAVVHAEDEHPEDDQAIRAIEAALRDSTASKRVG